MKQTTIITNNLLVFDNKKEVLLDINPHAANQEGELIITEITEAINAFLLMEKQVINKKKLGQAYKEITFAKK